MPGGVFCCTFSNRVFPTKAVLGWLYATEEQRPLIVAAYFTAVRGWDDPVVERQTDARSCRRSAVGSLGPEPTSRARLGVRCRMTLKQYVIDEIAQDCREGLLSRREAIRRLGFLGVGAALATSMLAGCSDDEGDPTIGSAGRGDDRFGRWRRPHRRRRRSGEIDQVRRTGRRADRLVQGRHRPEGCGAHRPREPGPDRPLRRLSPPGSPATATRHSPSTWCRARAGQPHSPTRPPCRASSTSISDADRVADLRAGVGELQKRASGQKVGVMGFCFGGGMVWHLLQAGDDRLAAAVPFYGPAPDTPDFTKAKAAVLAIYGGRGHRVNDTRPRAEAALKAANLTHEIKVFDGARPRLLQRHRPANYNPTAAADAYRQVLAWFGNHLKS